MKGAGETDVNKRDTASALLEFTFWLGEMDNKQVNTQGPFRQCYVQRRKQSRVLDVERFEGSGTPLDKAIGLGKPLRVVMLVLKPA